VKITQQSFSVCSDSSFCVKIANKHGMRVLFMTGPPSYIITSQVAVYKSYVVYGKQLEILLSKYFS